MKKKIGASKSLKKYATAGQVGVQTPIKKGASGPGITGVRKAVFNEAKSDWGEKPNTQWSYDQMSKWKSDVSKKPNYKKGGSVGTSKKPKMAKGGTTPFGMLSVKKGIDNNPKPTAADRIAGATMKKGGTVKKSSKKK
jgi:hypothetical protein